VKVVVKRILVLFGLATAAIASVNGQKLAPIVRFDRNPIGLGERVYLSIDINYEDALKVDVTRVIWPDGIALLTGPTIRPITDPTDPVRPRKVRIGYSLRADRIGRIIFDSIAVKAADAVAETGSFVLGVGYWRNREVFIPLRCEWQVTDGPVIVGQNVRAVLILRDMIEIPAIGEVRTPQIAGALIEQVGEVGPLERTVAGPEVIFQLPVAAFLVTPSRAGPITLPKVPVQVADVTVESAATSLSVTAAPEGAAASGAVGDLVFAVQIPSAGLATGDEVVIPVRVTGTGNLNYLELPKPQVEGLVLIETVPADDYRPGFDAYVGSREERHRYVAQTEGVATVAIPPFSWIDPENGRLSTTRTRTVSIEVSSRDRRPAPADEFPFALETATQILAHRETDAYRTPSNYLWLIPGGLACVVLALLKKARIIFVSLFVVFLGAGGSEPHPGIEAAIDAYERGDYEEASMRFGELLETKSGNPGLWYNRAIAEYRSGGALEATRMVRRAITRAPSIPRYRDLARWMNDRAGLSTVVYPALPVDLELLFILFMIASIVASGVGIANLARSRGILVIAGILAFVTAVAAGGTIYSVDRYNRKPTGVVAIDGADLRSIPSAAAANRAVLPAGESLKIIDRHGEFVLVENGIGRSGWVVAGSILVDGKTDDIGADLDDTIESGTGSGAALDSSTADG
jgi:hypothetical protein